MRKFLFLFLVGLFAGPGTSAQPAFWQSYFGGSLYDEGQKVILLGDGTMVIAANVYSSDGLGDKARSESGDVVIYKVSTQGRLFWKLTLGGTEEDQISDLIETRNGGFALIGTSRSGDGDLPGNRGGSDIWLAKLDGYGKLNWSRNYGGTQDDRGLALLEVEGGWLIAGESASRDGDMRSPHHGGLDGWIAKIDPRGELIWERHYGGSGNEKVNRLHQVSPHEFIAIGSSDSENGDVRQNLGKKDVWLFNISAGGQIIMQQSYGGEENDDVHDSYRAPNGNLYLAGTTFSSTKLVPKQQGQGDAWFFMIEPSGILHWSRTYGGTRPDGLSAVYPTADGGFVLSGMTKSKTGSGDIEFNAGYYDGWLIKTDENGQRKWSRTLGFEGKDAINDVLEVPSGGFLTVGLSFAPVKGIEGERAIPPGHHGLADVWLVNVGDPERSGIRPFVTPPIMIGKVLDKNTGDPLAAEMIITDNISLDSLTGTSSRPEDGSFSLLMPSHGLVSINVITKGYMFFGQDLWMDSLNDRSGFQRTFELEPIRIGSSLILRNIYFNTGQWSLLRESFAELERVEKFLRLNPRVMIQVSGHTDNTGNRNEKMQLSLNRANAVKDYLVEQGIEPFRLRVKGYGMYRPIASNRTAAGRKLNRRVEFEVINM